jgi:hypothetical protein
MMTFSLLHKLKRPSELRTLASQFALRQLVYYLHYICVPEVMEVSTSFSSSQEVENERLMVCRLLIEIDPANANDYEAELREITRKQVIQGGIRQVEQSKVSLDLEPVRRWAERHLKESFARFQSLVSVANLAASGTVALETDEPEAESRKTLANPQTLSEGLQDLGQDLPAVPANEAVSLLINMVSQLLGECYLNPFNGLDCYLSMRIRHGALSGQLRAPLEEERLITQRDSSSEEYLATVFWMHRLEPFGPDIRNGVNERLRSFSRDYDALINSFARDQIQIRSTEREKGLFTATVPQERLVLLAHEIDCSTTFDSFVDLCFAVFWESVEASLEDVRQYIDRTVGPEMQALFLSLMTDIEAIDSDFSIPDLNNAIRSSATKAHQALDQVKNWFRQAKPLPPKTYSFKEIVEIGLQQVRRIYHDFAPGLTIDIGEMPPVGDLTRFSDIFFIIFANIAKHSGIAETPRTKVSAQLTGSLLRIEVENDVALSSITPDVRARVDGIKAVIEKGGYHQAVRSEGGTGLIKLRNLAVRDQGMVDFGFGEDDTFVVRVVIPVKLYEMGEKD